MLLLTTWKAEAWSLGGSLRWQDDFHYKTAASSTHGRQKAYALLGANADYAWNEHMSMGLIVDNLSNEKYYNSFYWADIYDWDQAYHGAPRNAKLTVNLRW